MQPAALVAAALCIGAALGRRSDVPQRHRVRSDAAETEVPPPVNVGPDGYPQLPAVSAMLGGAAETLKSINSQASVLEKRVVQAQMENEAKMARQKAVFEQKLKLQEGRNRNMVLANKQIIAEITATRANNSAVRSHAKATQESNKIMRMELHALQARLSAMQGFITESLQRTDDSSAQELTVLGGMRPQRKARHHHNYVEAAHKVDQVDKVEKVVNVDRVDKVDKAENVEKADKAEKADSSDEDEDDQDDDQEEDDADDGPEGEALLAVSEKVRRSTIEAEMPATEDGDGAESNPNDLLAVLSKGVTELQQEERASEGRLKTMFLTNFQAGAKRHAALTAQQKQLNATRTAVRALSPRLHAADKRLDRSHNDLERRLRGLGLFAQKLAHLALAPVAEVPNQLKALPKDVAIAPEQL